MSKTIEFEASKMEAKFRVMARKTGGKVIMLGSWSTYDAAEQSCWRYPATDDIYELYIEKVWIKKEARP